jgi:serine/threonine-protein kinase
VQILDYGLHDGTTPYIAMEYLEGQSLADRLERIGALPLAQVSLIVTHTARAMTRAHEEGIVHRDIKPENIFLVPNEDEEIAKVLDFGIAKVTKRLSQGISETTRVGQLLGSPNYMSPEQCEGNLPVDYRTDLWSLAVIAFECVTGRMAFSSEALGELMLSIARGPMPVPSAVSDVPPGFDAWFARAAARDPAQRFQSAREMAERLRDVLGAAGRPVQRTPSPFAGLLELTAPKRSGTFPARGKAPPNQSATVLRDGAPESPPPKKAAR